MIASSAQFEKRTEAETDNRTSEQTPFPVDNSGHISSVRRGYMEYLAALQAGEVVPVEQSHMVGS